MSKSPEGRILYCDVRGCKEETLTRVNLFHARDMPEKRGWIHFEKDSSTKHGTIMGYREKHFCSRKCFDTWLKLQADNVEFCATMGSWENLADKVCSECSKEIDGSHYHRQASLCLSCFYSLDINHDFMDL